MTERNKIRCDFADVADASVAEKYVRCDYVVMVNDTNVGVATVTYVYQQGTFVADPTDIDIDIDIDDPADESMQSIESDVAALLQNTQPDTRAINYYAADYANALSDLITDVRDFEILDKIAALIE